MIRLFFTIAILCTSSFSHASKFSVATFEVDVTVPMGHALMGGGIAPAKEVVDPLSAQGIVLLGAGAPLVWLSLDWCEVRNDAYDAWRDALAEAAGTSRERVLFACIHQHDTPVADFTAQALLDEVGLEKSLCDVPFVKECIALSAAALKNSLSTAQSVTHYGVGKAKVEGVTSNRRVLDENGKGVFHRNSSCANESLRAQPEGTIDPWVKTLSFWDGEKPVAAMSTYAVHPMSYYGRGGVSADFVGMARAKMQSEVPDAKYLYFSGCSGDVVAGKFNDGSEGERPKLAERLFRGMKAAWDTTERYALEKVQFKNAVLELPMRETESFTAEAQRAVLEDENAKPFNRNLAAMGLSWRTAQTKGNTIDVGMVDFGKAQFLLMPAESFVGFQLEAQSLRPDSTVLVAGYGESAPGYIPTAAAEGEGFIDGHTWCWVHHGAHQAMSDVMKRALR